MPPSAKTSIERRVWQTSAGVALMRAKAGKGAVLWLLFQGERFVDGWAVGAKLNNAIFAEVVEHRPWAYNRAFSTSEEREPWWARMKLKPNEAVSVDRHDVAFGLG